MKTIIIAIRPEWACKILNGDKKIEVRKGLALYNTLKKAEERGEEVEFLMYVTKAKPYLRIFPFCLTEKFFQLTEDNFHSLNGKVVAKFKAKADKITEVSTVPLEFYKGEQQFTVYILEDMDYDDLLRKSRLSDEQMFVYLHDGKDTEEKGTALHIEDLEIFDKPKTLADYGLKRAPESWCYAKEAL